VDPFELWDREPAELPVSGNLTGVDGSPRTVVAYLDAEQGHFAIYNVGRLRVLAGQFWESALDGVPTLQE
jgi:hypothetical protein